MPQTNCSVLGCKERGGFKFPKKPDLREQWIRAIKRNHTNWTPESFSLVCIKHFQSHDLYRKSKDMRLYLKKTAVPKLFDWNKNKFDPLGANELAKEILLDEPKITNSEPEKKVEETPSLPLKVEIKEIKEEVLSDNDEKEDEVAEPLDNLESENQMEVNGNLNLDLIVYSCELCPFFDVKKEMIVHYFINHPGREDDLRKMIQMREETEEQNEDDLEGEDFPEKSDEEEEEDNEIQFRIPGEFSCHQCDFKNSRKEDMVLHYFMMHPDKEKELDIVFLNSMPPPEKERKVSKKIKCIFENCSYSSSSLWVHLKSNHGITRQCQTCSLDCKNLERAVRHHFKVHKGIYKCPSCQFSHSNYAEYKNHQATGCNRTVVCTVCGKSIGRHSLSTHMKYVHWKEPEKCELCDYKTTRTEFMKRHRMAKHGPGLPKRFACHICGRMFSFKCNMNVHIRTIHKESVK